MNDSKTITDYIHNQPPSYHLQAMGPIATLRDQFAMAALKGLLSNNVADHVAIRKANEIADAMMEARK